ncbi:MULTISPECIES: acyl CoA:acetate/3-ketoacid CoA transferase [Halobacterium]|uniref:acyl CoA:acetate/3-ketoacid CoA transferase n=1 Tax=Halobacterium TaxID=2239 RepID=UPI001965732A|nr:MULTISPECIES: acyl CoA:acetate/3-ketoacid CoA transferase [unclassified Halobacterium]QRY21703.1 acyl CoA:acetate/3-ketoacid CoA transferase [Halobacterium sp. GSL-19]
MVTQQSRREAVACVESGDTVGIGGFVATGIPEAVLAALGDRYERTRAPQDLTLYQPAAEGDRQGHGVSHLVQEGMLERTIASHWGFTPDLMAAVVNNEIEAYNLPFGVLDHLLRDTAAGKPGTITHVGLDTFVDPRRDGGKANAVTSEDLVERVTLDGTEYLFYHAVPIDVAVIRGTTADEHGNVTMEREALASNMLALAQAAHNTGGRVIAQVERVTSAGTLAPHDVAVPGVVVDSVVEAPPEDHPQTYGSAYDPAHSGTVRPPAPSTDPLPIDERTIIARRAAMELDAGAVINLGVGIPELVSTAAAEGGVGDAITETVESGPVGGAASGGIEFGTAVNHAALVSSPQQFDFYDGGGLDVGFLGMAQVDAQGNVNVSRFGSQFPGCGGFINITQNAAAVVFCGTLTTGGLSVAVADGTITVTSEGAHSKFVEDVEHVTFSADHALETDQSVVYVTERAVFELTPDGLTLTEVAPGIDPGAVIAQLGFDPAVADPLGVMPARLFADAPPDLTDVV